MWIKPTSGEKTYGFLALRGLSAAPLGSKENRMAIHGSRSKVEMPAHTRISNARRLDLQGIFSHNQRYISKIYP